MGKLRLLAALLITSTAFASTDLGRVNGAIKEVLSPFQTDATRARMTVKQLEVGDDDRLSVTGSYGRKAGGLEVALKLSTFTYDHKGGEDPEVITRGNLVFDPYELWGEEPTREWVADLQKEIVDRFKKRVEAYGKAAEVQGSVKSLSQDDQPKNFPGVRARVVTEIDVNEISDQKLKKGLLLQRVELRFDVTKRGIPFELKMTLNPSYSGFVDNQRSLSDFLSNLEKADKSSLQTVYNFVEYLDRFTAEAMKTHSPKTFFNLLPNRK